MKHNVRHLPFTLLSILFGAKSALACDGVFLSHIARIGESFPWFYGHWLLLSFPLVLIIWVLLQSASDRLKLSWTDKRIFAVTGIAVIAIISVADSFWICAVLLLPFLVWSGLRLFPLINKPGGLLRRFPVLKIAAIGAVGFLILLPGLLSSLLFPVKWILFSWITFPLWYLITATKPTERVNFKGLALAGLLISGAQVGTLIAEIQHFIRPFSGCDPVNHAIFENVRCNIRGKAGIVVMDGYVDEVRCQ